MNNIYDYGDFVAALNKNGVGLAMDSSDFMNIPKGHSKSKFTGGCPKLSDIKFVSLNMVLPKYIGKWTIIRVPTN